MTGDRQFYESLPPFMPLLLSHRNVDIPLKGNTFQGYYEDEDNRLLNDSSTPRACNFYPQFFDQFKAVLTLPVQFCLLLMNVCPVSLVQKDKLSVCDKSFV